MAIERTSPYIWQPALVDKIADLAGKEIVEMWHNDEIPLKIEHSPFTGTPYYTYNEEQVVETAILRVIGKIKMIMPDEVYDRIYEHPCLDRYLHIIDRHIKALEIKKYKPSIGYKPLSAQLADVGMSVRDFV